MRHTRRTVRLVCQLFWQGLGLYPPMDANERDCLYVEAGKDWFLLLSDFCFDLAKYFHGSSR